MSRRKLIRSITLLTTLLVLTAFGVGVNQEGRVAVPDINKPLRPGFYQVKNVSDGDTFQVVIAGKTETVRMIGIDTPETRDPRKAVQCFGKVASDQTKKMIEGKSVRLEGDPTDTDRDKYRRLLRYVYLEDGTFLNQNLVQNGFAFAYTVFPNQKLEQFRAWEREARENNRGLWGGCRIKDGEIKQTNDQ